MDVNLFFFGGGFWEGDWRDYFFLRESGVEMVKNGLIYLFTKMCEFAFWDK